MTFIAQSQQLLKANGSFSDPIFCLGLSLIFIFGGLGNFGEHRQMLEQIAESPWSNTINAIGDPSALLWISGAIFVPAGVALAVGIYDPGVLCSAFRDAGANYDYSARGTGPRRTVVQEHCYPWCVDSFRRSTESLH
ncbi:hypothetical protein [Afipia broomeae]|uniref:hypothetical protein n=1 Tax=Afipia broomeae TaxID=56946 RepID=UPI0012F7BB9E|nr:hypothetical protein [Afipia broomeae]